MKGFPDKTISEDFKVYLPKNLTDKQYNLSKKKKKDFNNSVSMFEIYRLCFVPFFLSFQSVPVACGCC